MISRSSSWPLAKARASLAGVGAASNPCEQPPMALDGGAIDAALGGGLKLAALHEITTNGIDVEYAAAPTSFLANLLSHLPGTAPLFWVAQSCDLYPPGLTALGLDPARLIQLRAACDDEALGLMETVLRAGVAAAVVGEIGRAGPLAGRRLQLSCLGRGSTGFVLRRFPLGARPATPLTAAVSRWQIVSAPGHITQHAPGMRTPGGLRWHAELLHSRGGLTGSWIVEHQEQTDASHRRPTHPFRLVAELAHQAPSAQRRLAS